jgi:bifunctional N-acetylglucosamine-1-phosphate-uridyltransferase/glucosamine-1-phosphate-acetyltransferase GlmU-like protein
MRFNGHVACRPRELFPLHTDAVRAASMPERRWGRPAQIVLSLEKIGGSNPRGYGRIVQKKAGEERDPVEEYAAFDKGRHVHPP